MIYTHLAAAIVAAAIAATAAYKVQDWRYGEQIATMKADQPQPLRQVSQAQGFRNRLDSQNSRKHKMTQLNETNRPALLLMLFAALVTGCATTTPPPCVQAVNPLPPAVSTPLPSVDYSITARETLERWRNALKLTPTM